MTAANVVPPKLEAIDFQAMDGACCCTHVTPESTLNHIPPTVVVVFVATAASLVPSELDVILSQETFRGAEDRRTQVVPESLLVYIPLPDSLRTHAANFVPSELEVTEVHIDTGAEDRRIQVSPESLLVYISPGIEEPPLTSLAHATKFVPVESDAIELHLFPGADVFVQLPPESALFHICPEMLFEHTTKFLPFESDAIQVKVFVDTNVLFVQLSPESVLVYTWALLAEARANFVPSELEAI
jgi:hypothetical protein